MTEEYNKNVYNDTKSREEFIGTLLLSDWEMPRATAIAAWTKLSTKKTRGRPKKVAPIKSDEPEQVYDLGEYFPETEKKQPTIMKWLDFKDMCKYTKSRDKINRQMLTKYGFIQTEINWLVDNGYVKYGGYEG